MKNILKHIGVMIILLIIYMSSLFLTSLIPRDSIKENVKETAQILNEQTNQVFIKSILKNKDIKYDNYTDALMISTAYSIDENSPLESILLCRKNYIPGVTKIVFPDTASELKSASKYKELDQVGELNDTVNNDIEESFEYARYWHGYLVILRVLLCFFNINTIRIIFITLFIMLLAWLLYLIYKKLDIYTALIFLVAFIGIEYLKIGFALQSSSVFFIMIISSIYLMYRYDKIKNFTILFLVIGSLASFFDLLTVPLITLGIPFTLFFLLKQKEKELSFKETIIWIFKLALSWGMGYVVTWISKWIIVDIICDRNIFEISIEQFLYRSTGNNVKFIDTFFTNYYYIRGFIIVASTISLIYIIKNAKNFTNKVEFVRTIPYITVTIMPIAWYFILKQHSFQHFFFTYRNTILLVIGISLIIKNLFKEDSNIKRLEEKT